MGIWWKNVKRLKFHPKRVREYIDKALSSVESKSFILLSFFGCSQLGKSTLSKIITGIDHEIGNGINSETSGATIAYAGTIKDINLLR